MHDMTLHDDRVWLFVLHQIGYFDSKQSQKTSNSSAREAQLRDKVSVLCFIQVPKNL